MSSAPGYKVRKLAALLSKSLPEKKGMPVVWSAEEIYPARGAWRKKSMDVWSWQAYAQYADNSGCAYHVGSYATITELIKEKLLELYSDEVYGALPATTQPLPHTRACRCAAGEEFA
jgi:hypothetical protein